MKQKDIDRADTLNRRLAFLSDLLKRKKDWVDLGIRLVRGHETIGYNFENFQVRLEVMIRAEIEDTERALEAIGIELTNHEPRREVTVLSLRTLSPILDSNL